MHHLHLLRRCIKSPLARPPPGDDDVQLSNVHAIVAAGWLSLHEASGHFSDGSDVFTSLINIGSIG